VYLTGATLFLSLILSRVFYIILDFITVQEQYTALQTKSAKSSGNAGESDELRKRIRALEAELGKSQSTDRDFGMFTLFVVATRILLLIFRFSTPRFLSELWNVPLTCRNLEEAGFSAKCRVQQACR